MKNFIILVLILLVIGFVLKSRSGHASSDDSADAQGPITNPVYAQVRFQADIRDRTFHLVAVAQGRNDADCKRMLTDLPDRMQMGRKPDGTPLWNLESSDCSKELEKRTARLFDNKPTYVSYVSASPGAPDEREIRMILWGVTARESEFVCEELPHLREKWKGTLTCIHALPPQ